MAFSTRLCSIMGGNSAEQAIADLHLGVQALFHAPSGFPGRGGSRPVPAQVAGALGVGFPHGGHAGAQQGNQVFCMMLARGGSVSIRWSMLANVLNRKCGSTWPAWRPCALSTT